MKAREFDFYHPQETENKQTLRFMFLFLSDIFYYYYFRIYKTRLALASVLGPFGTFAEIHSTHPGALMHYFKV